MFAQHVRDTSIPDRTRLQALTGVPLLAEIPADRNARMSPIAIDQDPGSRRAEAYRRLRTNLQFHGGVLSWTALSYDNALNDLRRHQHHLHHLIVHAMKTGAGLLAAYLLAVLIAAYLSGLIWLVLAAAVGGMLTPLLLLVGKARIDLRRCRSMHK